MVILYCVCVCVCVCLCVRERERDSSDLDNLLTCIKIIVSWIAKKVGICVTKVSNTS